VRVCKTCQTVLVGKAGPGRKRVTCSPDCARVWDNAKRRASRARLLVIDHLDRAMLAAGEVDPTLWKRLERVKTWVSITDPKIFAKILPRDVEPVDPPVPLDQWRQNRLGFWPDPEG